MTKQKHDVLKSHSFVDPVKVGSMREIRTLDIVSHSRRLGRLSSLQGQERK